VSKGSTSAGGVLLVALGGLVIGGAWSFWTREPRTTGFLVAALVFAVLAVLLLVAGILRIA
jgi:hypothetical protein